MTDRIMTVCKDCPKECGASRTFAYGACGEGREIRAAKAYLHMFEEPPLSGDKGSGTVFFSGCNLSCVFCQNHEISQDGKGKPLTVTQLAEVFKKLEAAGAHNINLVSPTQHSAGIVKALEIYRPQIPVVYNTNGYEKAEIIERMNAYIDIYLTDLKYFSPELSLKYSGAGDYFERAVSAIEVMRRKPDIFSDGLMKSGLIIRHLVLPGAYADSLRVLDEIAARFPGTLVSIMGQYYPAHKAGQYKEINRSLTSFEYNKVKEHAQKLNLRGFFQEKAGSTAKYTPAFDFEGITGTI